MANRQPNAMASSASSVQRGSFNRPSVPQQTNQMPGYGHTTNVDSMRAMNSNGADVQLMGNTNRNSIVYNNRNLSARYNGRSRSPSEGTNPEEEKDCCGARSPLQWLCPTDDRANNGSARRSFFQQRAVNYNNQTMTKTTPKDARAKAAQKLLKAESDEELEAELMNITFPETTFTQGSNQGTTSKNMTDSPASSISHQSTLRINTQLPYIQLSSNQEQVGLRPIQGEARIVAPNVSKLSPFSAVEVRLESASETVAVLCSVDVLKMRSSFFHDILSDQEKNVLAGGNQSMTSTALQGSVLWRDPIIITESSPFEAAAFLESLHEGRVLFRGEWNLCWARLSVSWGIEDLVQEYAAQITEHLNKLMSLIQTYHWRLNPAVLNGMRIAVFRKSSNTMPTVVTGMIVESSATIGYSKLRVAFENEKGFGKSTGNVLPPSYNNGLQSPAFISVRSDANFVNRYSTHPGHGHNNFQLNPSHQHQQPQHSQQQQSQHEVEQLFTPVSRFSTGHTPFGTSPSLPSTDHLHFDQSQHQHLPQSLSQQQTQTQSMSQQSSNQQPTQQSSIPNIMHTVIGDVGEPFWIQSTKEGSVWTEPDDLFLIESRRFITTTDKRIFWEMARALIELPEISAACKCSIRNASDLTIFLKKPECTVFWTMDGPDILPKDMAADFVRHAYVLRYNNNGGSAV